jgi:hypothetical protein
MSSETVKPTPATAPTPAITGVLSARRATPSRRASTAEPATPSGLPMRYAATMPSVIGEANARPRSPESTWMPAFASANSGTMAKLTHG